MMKPILTAHEMRAAERRLFDAGTSVAELMERAGAAIAEAAWRFAGPMPALVLAGPGNNGGDGYVAARRLAERGLEVKVAALAKPGSDAARQARGRWRGETVPLDEAAPRPLLIDALFGTGLSRGLDGEPAALLRGLAGAARICIAADLPSGVETDGGALLSEVPRFDLTVALGAMKPAHRLFPGADRCGRVAVADIGIEARSDLFEIAPPRLAPPGPEDHKYRRGHVAVLAGEMTGASALAASAALRAGAGYVRLFARERVAGVPSAVVQSPGDPAAAFEDGRADALLIGPGLGRSEAAKTLLDRALASDRPLVLDGDALGLIAPQRLRGLARRAILTPHEGEFERMFPGAEGSKWQRARAAAEMSGAVVALKGADTIVAEPGGRTGFAPPSPHWLATAGTGDVLSGIVAALRAQGGDAFEAACAGVWLHGRAAEIAGPALLADDLLGALRRALVGASGQGQRRVRK
ncbi:MAG: NAD(P)H-hydrate dehydratase [Sphingomonadaceae bacterium]